jgi:hypothetical protein
LHPSTSSTSSTSKLTSISKLAETTTERHHEPEYTPRHFRLDLLPSAAPTERNATTNGSPAHKEHPISLTSHQQTHCDRNGTDTDADADADADVTQPVTNVSLDATLTLSQHADVEATLQDSGTADTNRSSGTRLC